MNLIDNHSFGDSVNRIYLHREKLKFCLSLHNKYAIRNCVQEVVSKIDFFIAKLFVPFLDNEIKKAVDEKCYYKVKHILNDNKCQFEEFSTEKRRLNVFKKDSIYIDPIQFKIGEENVKKLISDDDFIIELFPVHAVRIPLSYSLKVLFELPDFYEEVSKYITALKNENNIISNFIQGKLWKQKYQNLYEQDSTYPLFLFFDDFETGCALGTAAGEQKLGGVYTSIPCLPPHMVAKMRCIFLSTIVYSKHREEFGTESAFGELICKLNYLREKGLTINVNGSEKTLFFQCVLAIGDNLGLNCTCGFSKSFSANYYCRICSASSHECKEFVREVVSVLRTRESYEADLVKRDPSLTGVVERCVFNNIDNFHIVENQSIDVMHDIFEGIADYTIKNVLYALIYKEKLYYSL